MKIARIAAACALTGVMLLGVFPASAAVHSLTEHYVGSFDPLTFGRCRSGAVTENVGEVCFPVLSTDHTVKFTSVDTVLGEAGLFYEMIDSTGNCVGQPADPTASCPNDDFVCGHSPVLAIPATTVKIEVYTLGSLGIVDCTGLEGSDAIGAATTGTITATFT